MQLHKCSHSIKLTARCVSDRRARAEPSITFVSNNGAYWSRLQANSQTRTSIGPQVAGDCAHPRTRGEMRERDRTMLAVSGSTHHILTIKNSLPCNSLASILLALQTRTMFTGRGSNSKKACDLLKELMGQVATKAMQHSTAQLPERDTYLIYSKLIIFTA